ATFAISNLGMFDVENFIAIILPPHAAMLATGTVKARPVVRDGQVVVRQTMTTTISVDHRVTDGVEAAIYLREYKRYLEEPLLLLV
ncbi:MAG: 2-oxo acid dehydrogenase subunit E2, partial [Chloroflexota bacterium]|nr:2-oxo acid dehydrogenase subunit E2 [Chloroflexota bacterium]